MSRSNVSSSPEERVSELSLITGASPWIRSATVLMRALILDLAAMASSRISGLGSPVTGASDWARLVAEKCSEFLDTAMFPVVDCCDIHSEGRSGLVVAQPTTHDEANSRLFSIRQTLQRTLQAFVRDRPEFGDAAGLRPHPSLGILVIRDE